MKVVVVYCPVVVGGCFMVCVCSFWVCVPEAVTVSVASVVGMTGVFVFTEAV